MEKLPPTLASPEPTAALPAAGLAPGDRVVVALSGGVDSAVAAALLVEAGYDAVGITLQLYDHGAATGRPGSCCAGEDIHDARRIADRLAIPHYVLDYEARFRAGVIDDFAAGYARGETPVPCVRCNQRVKFRDLLQTALDLGARALATGHYVERRDGAAGPQLWRGADHGRDQSYFLFQTTKEQLARLVFPLGRLGKDETRAIARRHRLPVAGKRDSQDICFVPDGKYAAVLAALAPTAMRPGAIVDEAGRELGRHAGIGRFTVGQRRGLGLGDRGGEPLFVLRLEPETAQVVVGPRAALGCDRFPLTEVNWLGDGAAPPRSRVEVKLRSAMAPVAATLALDGAGGGEAILDEPYAGVAPGQACVFYAGARLLGGGWIGRTGAGGPPTPAIVTRS